MTQNKLNSVEGTFAGDLTVANEDIYSKTTGSSDDFAGYLANLEDRIEKLEALAKPNQGSELFKEIMRS